MIQERDDIVALDSAIIQHPRTWEASGHLAGLQRPARSSAATCKLRFRADHLRRRSRRHAEQPDPLRASPSKLPGDHQDCELTERARVQPDVRDRRSAR